MMLAEMEAYAKQALRIKELEDLVEQLREEIVAINEDNLPKTYVKSWFNSINGTYAFLTDEGKASAYTSLGEK